MSGTIKLVFSSLLMGEVSSAIAGQTIYNLFPTCCPATKLYAAGSPTDECDNYNACAYYNTSTCPTSASDSLCYAEASSGKITLAQAKSQNFVSFYDQSKSSDAAWTSTYQNQMITVTASSASGPVTFTAKIIDTCSDGDVSEGGSNCDANAVEGFLVDVEFYTAQRYNLFDSSNVTWSLGSVPPTPKPTPVSNSCPSGWKTFGDGSACTNNVYQCALWGNANLPPCKCPGAFRPYGDGSACSDGTYSCALWGNVGQNRCVCDYAQGFRPFGDGSACTVPPATAPCALWGNAGMSRCCPNGYTLYGDGSACTTGTSGSTCALWGNGSMRRCF